MGHKEVDGKTYVSKDVSMKHLPQAFWTFCWQEDDSCAIILPVRCFDTDILSILISLRHIDDVKCISFCQFNWSPVPEGDKEAEFLTQQGSGSVVRPTTNGFLFIFYAGFFFQQPFSRLACSGTHTLIVYAHRCVNVCSRRLCVSCASWVQKVFTPFEILMANASRWNEKFIIFGCVHTLGGSSHGGHSGTVQVLHLRQSPEFWVHLSGFYPGFTHKKKEGREVKRSAWRAQRQIWTQI